VTPDDGIELLPDGSPATGNAEYDALPRAVKDLHPYEGWLWLSGAEKGGLTQSETEPEF
jgi:hypothetical protein